MNLVSKNTKMESGKDKLKKIASQETSKWMEDVKWRTKNESWLDTSFAIAVRILSELRKQKMTQTELAALVGVTPQQINKIVKGSENLTLETIRKIELALSVTLIEVTEFYTSVEYNPSFYAPAFSQSQNATKVATKDYEAVPDGKYVEEQSKQEYKTAA